jgi:hypothetical protein
MRTAFITVKTRKWGNEATIVIIFILFSAFIAEQNKTTMLTALWQSVFEQEEIFNNLQVVASCSH